MATIFDDHAQQALRDHGGDYEAARCAIRRQMADAGESLRWHYQAVLGALGSLRRAEREDNDA